ncbi:MAG: 50S ribosomal protein L11 methyltransferase [Candidatus Kryptonium sp.]
MKIWIEVSISNVPDELKDEVIYLVYQLETEGCWEDENSIKCYFKKENWTEEKEKILLNYVKEKASNVVVYINEVAEKNWNEIWEQSIEPIEIDEKLVIKPTWKEYHKPNKIIIQIDPKMSFGTGHHETTRLMLKAIEKYLYKDSKILDVGTGSGVLAIASVKLGAKMAIGVDNDQWAYENSIENAEINNVKDKFKQILGSIDDVNEKDFDFIFANINKNAIINMMESFYDKLKDKGFLIISGFIDVEQGTIEEYLRMQNFEIIDVLKENEWVAIVARK